jgi:hypothetical protein
MKPVLILFTAIALMALALPSAAAGPEQPRTIQPRASKVIYLGQSIQALDGRPLRLTSAPKAAVASGDIDVYNVWTSFEDIDIFNDLSLEGHAYVLCHDFDRSIFYGHLIYSFESLIELRVRYTWSRADNLNATVYYDLDDGPGYFLLVDEFDIDDFTAGYYKVVSKYTVTAGGNGNGKETCFFDVFFDCD